MKKKWGILGGAFDPLHLGHLRVAEEVYGALKVEKILFIPTANPPHKKDEKITPFSLRYQMVKLALEDIDYFEVSDIENQISGPSYSLLTLQKLKDLYPEIEPFFIMGFDAFKEIHTWYRFQELPQWAHLVVIRRGKDCPTQFPKLVSRFFPQAQGRNLLWQIPNFYSIRFLSTLFLPISSTMIRELRKKHQSIRFLVPEKVRKFILGKKLYSPK